MTYNRGRSGASRWCQPKRLIRYAWCFPRTLTTLTPTDCSGRASLVQLLPRGCSGLAGVADIIASRHISPLVAPAAGHRSPLQSGADPGPSETGCCRPQRLTPGKKRVGRHPQAAEGPVDPPPMVVSVLMRELNSCPCRRALPACRLPARVGDSPIHCVAVLYSSRWSGPVTRGVRRFSGAAILRE